jgi:hypothetical protein
MKEIIEYVLRDKSKKKHYRTLSLSSFVMGGTSSVLSLLRAVVLWQLPWELWEPPWVQWWPISPATSEAGMTAVEEFAIMGRKGSHDSENGFLNWLMRIPMPTTEFLRLIDA